MLPGTFDLMLQLHFLSIHNERFQANILKLSFCPGLLPFLGDITKQYKTFLITVLAIKSLVPQMTHSLTINFVMIIITSR